MERRVKRKGKKENITENREKIRVLAILVICCLKRKIIMIKINIMKIIQMKIHRMKNKQNKTKYDKMYRISP